MAFDLAGNLYTTNWDKNSMSKFDKTGVLIGSFGSGFNSRPESVVIDAAGNLYVGQAVTPHELLKFNASGVLLGSFSPAAGSGQLRRRRRLPAVRTARPHSSSPSPPEARSWSGTRASAGR
jgi:hypothetical protein